MFWRSSESARDISVRVGVSVNATISMNVYAMPGVGYRSALASGALSQWYDLLEAQDGFNPGVPSS